MAKRLFLGIGCAVLLLWPLAAPAQQRVEISYTTLGMDPVVDGSIVDVESDATNRVWVVAPKRLSAAVGDTRAALFPLTVTDFVENSGLAGDAVFRSVTFAGATGGEHFYLGTSRGIAWGRIAATVDYGGLLSVSETGTAPADQVNEIGADADGSWLWAATDGGLVLWDLAPAEPTVEDIFLDSGNELPSRFLAVAPWGEALVVGADGKKLWRVRAEGSVALVRDLGLSGGQFSGIAFAANGHLWALTTLTSGGHPLLLKFETDGTAADPPTGFTGVEKQFPLNPFVGTGTGAPAGFAPTDIAVDRFESRVWVTTRSNQGQMNTAFFQDPVDPSGDLETDPAVNNWGVVTSTFDRHNVVHADASGNVWFGMVGTSKEALNGYVLRLLTLDKSRYLGSTTAIVDLLDLTLAEDGTSGGEVMITIQVGSESRDLPATERGDTGEFSLSFRIIPSGGDGGGTDNEFLVGSSATDVPVSATYAFQDSNGLDRTLAAIASWANIVPFEDDLFIKGPCFLGLLSQ